MSIYIRAWHALVEEKVLLSKVVAAVVFLAFLQFYFNGGPMSKVLLVVVLIGILLIPILYVSLLGYLYRKHVLEKNEYLTTGESISIVVQLMIVGFVREVALVLLTLFFFIPGIMFAVYWNFVFDELITQRSPWFQALGASSKRVDGRWWHVFFDGIVQGIVYVMTLLIAFGASMVLLAGIKAFFPLPGLLALGNALMIGIFFLWALWCQAVHMCYYKECTPIQTETQE